MCVSVCERHGERGRERWGKGEMEGGKERKREKVR